MPKQTETRVIKIKIDTQGDKSLQNIARGMDKVSKNTKKTANSVNYLKNAFNAIAGFSFAGVGLASVIELADSMQLLEGRIAALTGEAEQAAMIMDSLATVANNVAVPIKTAAEVYNRLGLALGDIGIGTQGVLDITENLFKTFRLAGSSTAEMTGAVIQLSQGLASGQLRGQELRSVLEANAIVGGILAKSLGTTRGELLKFSEKRGGITAEETIKALSDSTESLDAQMSALGLTIGQRVIIEVNKAQIAFNNLNKELGLTTKVVATIDFLSSNIKILGAAFAGIAGASAIGTITAAIKFFGGVAVTGAAVAFGKLALVIGVVTAAFLYWDEILISVRKTVLDMKATTLGVVAEFLKFTSVAAGLGIAVQAMASEAIHLKTSLEDVEKSNPFNNFVVQSREAKVAVGDLGNLFEATFGKDKKAEVVTAADALEQTKSLQGLNLLMRDSLITMDQYKAKLIEIKTASIFKRAETGNIDLIERDKLIADLTKKTDRYALAIKAVDQSFAQTGNLQAYIQELSRISREDISGSFKKASEEVANLNDKIRDAQVTLYRQQLASTIITLERFEELNTGLRVATLNEQFKRGTIDIYEYNKAMNETVTTFDSGRTMAQGAKQYIDSVGTLSTQIAGSINNTFRATEDAFVSFIKTGKASFKDFAQGVLDDLQRIIIRAKIIAPLAQGLLNVTGDSGVQTTSVATTAGTGTFNSVAANGRAYNSSGVNYFANGGVFDSPTAFGYSGGMGVMGEAGPEAVMPLNRGSDGKLGVKAVPSNVIVNIINNSDSEVSQSETTNESGEKVMDILIITKVKEGFAKGSFDKQMSNTYGLRRRGN